ncbi:MULTISPECIES: TetR/AcrR family transcriptional regulator [Streptomyces]|uniref:TetR/AcrR family transcriptional regulator n=2 Tax=Streptomyces TaxID=1883 RepID=A0ABS9JS08_9ACTN|nr:MULTISPECIES: TetR/AcrR family transcriptional regulator [Streptomyces]MCG0068350.1 TetR/AcrR family transcriptional regulator [Streptomyces tricolor]OYP17729.1 TetR family transcriptional regulator [Streptomyces sp. FBKL.4005]BCM66770.1 putative TetR-family transcriptional regulator [Streptomyces sp. EAS-AB2608]CUW28347.1 HTH-type transcriptional repressor ComR [Streptomyces reticuli]
MARTKEFDPDAALQSALELFWQRGYEATSMADLVAHLGIGKASLYATFGSKHELYLRALDRYEQSGLAPIVHELSQPGPALPAVRSLVRRYAREATDEQSRLQGCMITNTAAELAPHDPAAARRVERNWDHLETLLHSALVRARGQGELPPGRDPLALARTLLVLLQGLRVVGKASTDPARIRDAAEQALTLLD